MKKEEVAKFHDIVAKIHDKNTYADLQPKLINRWVAQIDGIKIEPYLFQEISLPVITKKTTTWGRTKVVVEPITFSLIEIITTNHYGTFVEKLKNDTKFNITVQILDPTGAELTKFILENCVVTQISQSSLNYEKDSVLKTYVTVKPTGVKFSL